MLVLTALLLPGAALLPLAALQFLVTESAAASAPAELEALARKAFDGEATAADEAIEWLRQTGPEGMTAALGLFDGGTGAGSAALDRICGVHDCADIRLFWYTALETAKAAALAEGKPILSLRLLGRLDEELSCANSRFFRTALYSNREIGELLRRDFVLHWHSVRPVPKVTIDFGDGKTVEQTIAGNSVHYLLDSHGRLLDVLPGLYSPETFRRELATARETVAEANRVDDLSFPSWARGRFAATLKRLDSGFPKDTAPASAPRAPGPPAPGAIEGRTIVRGSDTAAKSSFEVTLATAVALGPDLSDDQLDRLAAKRRASVHLDDASRALLLRKQGVIDPEAGARLIASFEADIALDEVINESRYRRAILSGLVNSQVPVTWSLDLDLLTWWVYSMVFEDPISDPWMGLVRHDVYSALPLPPPPPPPPADLMGG